MGTVYRKTVTKPLPAGAEIITRKGERLARWKDSKGKSRTAAVTTGRGGADRIVITASTFTAKYRDGSGLVVEVATGCKDETAARSVLGELERRAELVKAKVLTVEQDAVADHQATPLSQHLDAYLTHQTGKGLHPTRICNARGRLNRMLAECDFKRLADLNATALERWLIARKADGMSAGNRNEYRQELVAFCNWCVRTYRLTANPFANVAKVDAKADCRRKRRAMTEAELVKLLDVARRRPLLDALTVRRGERKGEAAAKLRPAVRERLELLGRERALIYKTLVLTGLRRGELASISIGQLELDGPLPYLTLHAADEKNREGSQIPLRADLAAELAQWVADMRKARTSEPGASDGQCLPIAGPRPDDKLPADTKLFTVPAALVKIFDRDLVMAGLARRVEVNGKWRIDKRDERGRTLDVHALRHSFGTLLSKGNVAPRTAQAAMRHSTIDLTMNVYTDPKLLDVHGALDALPALPLDGGPQQEQIAAKATGTDDWRPAPFAPGFAPTTDKSCKCHFLATRPISAMSESIRPEEAQVLRLSTKTAR